MLVATAIGRREDGLGELGAFFENPLEQFPVQLFPAKAAVVILDVQEFLDDETDVAEGGAVGVHGLTFLLAVCRPILRDAT